jgi:sulfate adenylyltransferase subunit 1
MTNLSTLKFITCGSVDDGKSTLIGRLLVDSKAVLQDQLAGVSKSGAADLALFTDGLSAEREQGITIDVAYRYFSTPSRKFIIGDAPGHEQYTRNMVTAASSADAAVVLVDATKLDWKNPALALLAQTRRHTLLVHLLRVPSIVFAINKLDAVEDAGLALKNIGAALDAFAASAGITVAATVPISALNGSNVVERTDDFPTYQGDTLLAILERLPVSEPDAKLPFSFPVQWVEKFSGSSDTSQGRRVFWGRVASGSVRAGQEITVLPSGQTAKVAQVMDHARVPQDEIHSLSAGIVLDREVDVSRGDWLLAPGAFTTGRNITATIAWMDDTALIPGRLYWALHGHRWVKAKVTRIVSCLNVHTLDKEDAHELAPNGIGQVEIALQEPLATLPYAQSKTLGALILVDTASHKTSGAALIN